MRLTSRNSADGLRNGPDDPAETVVGRSSLPSLADRLIRDRFDTLLAHYQPAVERPGDDTEAVHQLRVSSRRLTAALQTLQPLLPGIRRRKLVRNLKAVRRAAGAARDLDVFRERVESSEFSLKRKTRKRVLTFLKKRRKKAQKPLRKVFRKQSPIKLTGKVDELLAMIPPQPGEFLLQDTACGSDLVEAAVARFSADVPAAFENAADLHQLRISAKRLRYTLETLLDLAAIPDPNAAACLLEDLKQIQERLGEINDHAVSQRRLRSWVDQTSRRSLRNAFAEMAVCEAAKAAAQTGEFCGWWSDERQQAFRRQLDELAQSPT